MELSAADTAMVVLPSDPQMTPSGVTDLRVAVCVGVAADTLHDLMIRWRGPQRERCLPTSYLAACRPLPSDQGSVRSLGRE